MHTLQIQLYSLAINILNILQPSNCLSKTLFSRAILSNNVFFNIRKYTSIAILYGLGDRLSVALLALNVQSNEVPWLVGPKHYSHIGIRWLDTTKTLFFGLRSMWF